MLPTEVRGITSLEADDRNRHLVSTGPETTGVPI